MEKDKEVTEVMFRKDNATEEIVALFPYVVEFHWLSCLSYAHIGQHSTATMNYRYDSKPAKPEEYKDLFNELESIGYNLKVISRFNRRKYSDIYHKPNQL